MATPPQRFKLIFFAPPLAVQACKTAVFGAGAGSFPGSGGYTECAWTSSLGKGQFRPGKGADPFIGKSGELEEVEEYRVETLCVGRDVTVKAVEALKKAHPYEEPAYEVYKMEDL